MKYSIDAANSEITWTGFIPSTGISGRVFFRDGIIETDPKNSSDITGGKLTIDIASIETLDDQLSKDDKRKLTAHLKSQDFFDADIHPVAEFTLLEVNALGDRPVSNTDGVIHPTHEVVGELSVRGIKQKVSALVNMQVEGGKIRVQSMFTLDRTMFGMDHLIDRSNGQQRVLPDMEIIVKVVADAIERPLGST